MYNKHNFLIKSLEESELELLAEFLSINHKIFNKNEWLEKFNLFWNMNPHFDNQNHKRGWIIINDKKEIYGFLGNIPLDYLINGIKKKIYCGTTWVVKSEARGSSLELYNEFNKQNGFLINTTATKNVESILSNIFHYRKVELPLLKNSYLLPINLLSCFKFFSIYFKNNIFNKIFSIILSFLLRLMGDLYNFMHNNKNSPISVNLCKNIPTDIESFNNQFVSKYNFVYQRNKESVKWIYFTDSNPPILFEIKDNNKLIGLISFKLVKENKIIRMELLDYSMLYTNNSIQKKIIIEIQKIIKNLKINVAFITLKSYSNIMHDELIKAGSYKFKQKSLSNFYIYNSNINEKIDNYYITPIDGDRSLF